MTNSQFLKYKLDGVESQNYLACLSSVMNNHSSMTDSVSLTIYKDKLVSNSQIFIGYYTTDTWYCDDDTTITGIQVGSTTFNVGQTLYFSNYSTGNTFYVLLHRRTEGDPVHTVTLNTAGKFLKENITVKVMA